MDKDIHNICQRHTGLYTGKNALYIQLVDKWQYPYKTGTISWILLIQDHYIICDKYKYFDGFISIDDGKNIEAER
jgi:hypothetical protein